MEKTKSKLNVAIVILCIVMVVLLSTGIYISKLAIDIAYVGVNKFITVIKTSEDLLIINALVNYELTDKENDKYSNYMASKYSNVNQDGEKNETNFWETLKLLRKEAKEVTK